MTRMHMHYCIDISNINTRNSFSKNISNDRFGDLLFSIILIISYTLKYRYI